MIGGWVLLSMALGFQGAAGGETSWVPYTSRDGNFVVDFPGKPTKSYSRQARSRTGMVKIVVVQCDTPDVLYTAEKIEISRPAGPEAGGNRGRSWITGERKWRENSTARSWRRRSSGSTRAPTDAISRSRGGRTPRRGWRRSGCANTSSQKVLYILVASTAADRELPEDVGHFFASFSPGTKRIKKVGPHPEPEGSPLGAGGSRSTPTSDCQIDDKGDALEISIPNTHHDLNADNDKLNAPRVVREVTGRFQPSP